jgi:soluble lytic murein transglycosylase-like protein
MRALIALALLLLQAPLLQPSHAAEPVDPELRARLEAAMAEATSFEDRFDAEVWLTDMVTRLGSQVADRDEALEILRIAHEEATRAGLPPELVLAVIDVESGFERFAISSAGARGLMQIMPWWRDELGRPDDNLFIIRTNLRYGCTILRYYMDMADDDMREALGRYHGSWGRSREYPDRVLSRLSERWFRY